MKVFIPGFIQNGYMYVIRTLCFKDCFKHLGLYGHAPWLCRLRLHIHGHGLCQLSFFYSRACIEL